MSSNRNYQLVNPYIEGSLTTVFSGNSALEAGHNAFKAFSKYVTNSLPVFYYTIQNLRTQDLYHFKVTEKRQDKLKVNYEIEEVKLDIPTDTRKEFLNVVREKQTTAKGGAKKNDDDDESSTTTSTATSSSSDGYLYRIRSPQPIYYWWYTPQIYLPTVKLTKVFIPTFSVPISPYVEVTLTLTK